MNFDYFSHNSSVYKASSYSFEQKNKNIDTTNLKKDNVTISYTDDTKNNKDFVTIGFRDPVSNQSMVTVNIDKDTYDKLASKYSKDNFENNQNGVVLLNKDAEKYVSNWYADVAYNRGYKQADSDGDGKISDLEYESVNAGVDAKFAYAYKDGVSNIEAQMEQQYMNIGKMNTLTKTSIKDVLNKLPDDLRREAEEKYKQEIKRANRSDEYFKQLNNIFQSDRPISLQDALNKTLSNDTNMDSSLTLDELNQNKEKSLQDIYKDISTKDYEANHLDVDFNQFKSVKLKQNSLKPQVEKKSSDNDIELMSLKEKEELMLGIQKLQDNTKSSINSTTQDYLAYSANVVNDNIDLFKDVFATQDNRQKEEDKQTNADVDSAISEAIATIDDPALAQKVKQELYLKRDTTNFRSKVHTYVSQIKQTNMKDEEKQAMGAEMVVLDEYLSTKNISKNEFLQNQQLQDEYFGNIKNRNDNTIDIMQNIIKPRNLDKKGWENELKELYDTYGRDKIAITGEMNNILLQNSINPNTNNINTKNLTLFADEYNTAQQNLKLFDAMQGTISKAYKSISGNDINQANREEIAQQHILRVQKLIQEYTQINEHSALDVVG